MEQVQVFSDGGGVQSLVSHRSAGKLIGRACFPSYNTE